MDEVRKTFRIVAASPTIDQRKLRCEKCPSQHAGMCTPKNETVAWLVLLLKSVCPENRW